MADQVAEIQAPFEVDQSNHSGVEKSPFEIVTPGELPDPEIQGEIRKTFSLRKLWEPLAMIGVTVVIVGVAWELIKLIWNVPDGRLPHIWQVIAYFGSTTSTGESEFVFLLHNMAVTLEEAAAGLILGIVVGGTVGFLTGKFPLFGAGVTPLIVLTQTLPIVAIAPALVIFLGQDELSLAIIASLLSFFPIAISVSRGVRDIPPDQTLLLKSFGATNRSIFAHLELPNALVQANAAIPTAAAFAVIGAIVAELPAGTENGISVVLLNAANSYTYQPEALWCAAIVAAVGGVLMVYVSRAIFAAVARAALRTRVLPSGGIA
jgi:NitT/TauT family transport system permease protein